MIVFVTITGLLLCRNSRLKTFQRKTALFVMNRLCLRRLATAIAPGLLLVAGCGGIAGTMGGASNDAFSISASNTAVNTAGQSNLKAVMNNGSAAPVNWKIVGGENDPQIGQGSIDARGSYIPPSAISHDQIEVTIQAQLRSDPTKVATEILSVSPSFLQALTPEVSALSPGGTVQISAELSEVGAGSVEWSLATAPVHGRTLGSNYGVLTQESCQHAPQNYTVCSVDYTAPPTIPSGRRHVYVVASMAGTVTSASAHILLNDAGIDSTPLANQAAQSALVQMGSSGGNVGDADTAHDGRGNAYVNDCCGGTLGALLQDQTGNQFILSNNHVLAESDQAELGDTILQPALIDSNCDQNAGRAVGSLRYAVRLASSQTNVDAALALVTPGSVDPSGAILQLGPVNPAVDSEPEPAAPAAGSGQAISAASFSPSAPTMLVAKSGRTTGLTCSSIDAIDLTVLVDYFKDCAESQPYYTKIFSHQIGIGGDAFADSGDSGALVVNAGNAEPIGLFFAGGTDDHGNGLSIANPIQDVLSELGAETGSPLNVVGGPPHPVSCLNYDTDAHSILSARTPSEQQMRKAEQVARKTGQNVVNPAQGILAVSVTRSVDNPTDAALLVYTDKTHPQVEVPQTLDGFRTVIVPVEPGTENSPSAPKAPAQSPGIRLPQGELQAAQAVEEAYAKRLMADPAIFGVGVGQSRDDRTQAALLVLVDMSRTPRATPPVVSGLRVRYIYLHRFHVTRSKHSGPARASACSPHLSLQNEQSRQFDPNREAPIELPETNR